MTLPSLRDLSEVEVKIPGPEHLVGRLGVIPGARAAMLLCHPHPLYGGSLDNKIMVLAARQMHAMGISWLRFNFRGVGGSTGTFGGKDAEIADVRAALNYLRQAVPGAALGLLGYSFGSYVGSWALLDEPDVQAYVGVAPPVSHFDLSPLERLTIPKLLILGTNDTFASIPDFERFVGRLQQVETVVLPGIDHYFMGAGRAWYEPIAPFLLHHLLGQPQG
ncbi:MAG: alpha/beta fold hydrolase [Candidatus Sericytochromatia bacterium]|nr:alpha/beta fold hydrolase [Candidatus Sericytochromatia bacterium]